MDNLGSLRSEKEDPTALQCEELEVLNPSRERLNREAGTLPPQLKEGSAREEVGKLSRPSL